ncbi:MAG: response regulator [Gammaproteobacteria bacterium]
MRLLLIEDEIPLSDQISTSLRQAGFAVDVANTGNDGLYLGIEYPIDVAVVDIGLPDISGIDVIKKWRESEQSFPILILTARGRWEEKVEGLESGADDYLVKPFHMEELIARLRALIRRSAGFSDSKISMGRFVLDTSSQKMLFDEEEVDVTAFEYKVLEYLILNADKVVSKSELSEHLYEDDFDRDSNVLEVIIGRLRKKLDPDKSLNPIETLRGRGYRFRAVEP